MFRKLVVSISLAGLLATAAVPLTGCYGSFALTKKIHTWNGQVSNKWVNTLIFWAFIIIPVYEVCTFVDGIVFNVIEFWSGKNVIGGGDAAAAPTTRGLADGSLEVKHEGVSYRLIPASADRFYLVAGGVTVGSGRISPEGGLTLYVQGRDEVRITHQQVRELEQRFAAADLNPVM